MTTSRRLADRKVEKFEKNITKRGAVPETTVKKGNDYPVGPVLLGFFIFVVIGSCRVEAIISERGNKECYSVSYCSFHGPFDGLLIAFFPPHASSISDNQDCNKWRHGLTMGADVEIWQQMDACVCFFNLLADN
ncbi:hypothetical protein L1049_006096 [Liquidambar formosana]|uniref:Uncharacterized protein n=1 Tax=Liquidambar formosana TaxID=63359 RepID=A0AAP0REX3_LIQFO